MRRDTREKIFVSLDGLEGKIAEVLEDIQQSLYNKALAHREECTFDAHGYEEFRDIAENKPGFIRGMWCGDEACEDKIKAETGATARCMPFEQEHIDDKCVCCGRPAKTMVYWGKAY